MRPKLNSVNKPWLHSFIGGLFIEMALIVLMGCQTSFDDHTGPYAQKGILDLRNWNFEQAGEVPLKGEWEFYWEKLHDASDPHWWNNHPPDGVLEIPNTWEGMELPDGRVLPLEGYATLRLRIKLPDFQNPHQILRLFLPVAGTASSLQIYDSQGPLLTSPLENGVVGTSPESHHSLLKDSHIALPVANEWVLVWQISSFEFTWAGPESTPILGLDADMLSIFHQNGLLSSLVASVFIVMGLYHWILFALRPEDKSSLWFGGFCFTMLIYGLIQSDYLAALFPSSALFELFESIGVASVCLSIVTFSLFLRSLFPHWVQGRWFQGFITLSSLPVVLNLFVPWHVLSAILEVYNGIILIWVGWVLWIILKAVREPQNRIAWMMFGGFLFLGISVIAEILDDFGIFNSPTDPWWGLICFIFFQAITIALQNRKVYQDKYRAEQQAVINLKQADKLKDEFLAKTSHELRTPLNGIIGLAESMIDEMDSRQSPNAIGSLTMIVQSGRRLSNLVNDILDFSQLREKRLKLVLNPVDLYQQVELVITMLKPTLYERPLTIQNRLSPSLPPVQADTNRVQQILYNLLGNAIKFTHEGTITIASEVTESSLFLHITDTGIGIPQDRQEHIFDHFEQITQSPDQQYEGTGLGLAITQQLVELHGGHLKVESEVGQGSTFTVSLPLSEEPAVFEVPITKASAPIEVETVTTSVSPSTPSPLAPSYSIMVVDDDRINLQVAKNHLSRQGYQVIECINGKEALQQLNEQTHPDLILLDIMMPEMNGYEVCQQIRQTFDRATLPILFLTAKGTVEDLAQGFEIGGNDYVVKPFYKAELFARIGALLHSLDTRKRLLSLKNIAELSPNRLKSSLLQELQHLQLAHQVGWTEDPAPLAFGNQFAEISEDVMASCEDAIRPFNPIVEGSLLEKRCGRDVIGKHLIYLRLPHENNLMYLYREAYQKAFSPLDLQYLDNLVHGLRLRQANTQKWLQTTRKQFEKLYENETHPIDEDTRYVQFENPYCRIVSDADEKLVSLSLKQIEDIYSDQLVRVSKTHLIHPRHIVELKKDEKRSKQKKSSLFNVAIRLKDTTIELPVGASYLAPLKEVLFQKNG